MSGVTLLLGCGTARTGTGWLFSFLQKHPQVLTTTMKSLHYFDTLHNPAAFGSYRAGLLRRLAKRGWDEEQVRAGEVPASDPVSAIADMVRVFDGTLPYVEVFSRQRRDEIYAADVTPEYSAISEDVLSHIVSTYPGARFVLNVRDPLEHFLSSIAMRAKGSSHTRQQEEVAKELSRPCRAQTEHVKRVLRFKKIVPQQQLHLDYSENFLTPEGIDRFCDWLHVERVEPDLAATVNKSDRLELGKEERRALAEHFAPSRAALAGAVGSRPPAAWRRCE